MKHPKDNSSDILTWQPAQWEYSTESTGQLLVITEATASDCFTFEQKASAISSDSAIDWLISNQAISKDGTAINNVTAIELGLTFPDKMAMVQIIKMQGVLKVEPLDNRSPSTSKHFRINHEDLSEGIEFTCEDPPFNHRASDSDDIPSALFEMAQNNITIQWLEFGIEPVVLGKANLDFLPYFVADVGIRHYSQLLSRVPKKKRLPRQ